MFIINQSNSNNQFIVNKNLLKHEQRINRKEEKAVVKLTWPMLLTTTNSSRKEFTGNKFSSFFQVLWVWFFSFRIGNLGFLTIHSDRELFWGFPCNASTQTDWKISLYSQWIRELDCNLKNKRSYNFFLVDQRVFQNLFLERSKVENIYILGCVFLKATRGTEIGVTE